MIRVFVVGTPEVMRKLGAIMPQASMQLYATVNKLALLLARRVKENRLSGDPLHVRTGTLRRSINSNTEVSNTGVRATVGTNVEYAAYHEYGFQGQVTVKQHLMNITQAWGHPISPKQVTVASHTRKVNYPGRPFLRPELELMQPEIEQSIENDIRTAIQKFWTGP